MSVEVGLPPHQKQEEAGNVGGYKFEEQWSNYYQMPSKVDLDFLFPHGIILTLTFTRETTLEQVKCRIWDDLRANYPSMADKYKSNDSYVFVSVTQEAKTIEYYDYTKRLCDLKLFFTFFKIVEAHGNLVEKSYNSDLSKAIGLYVNEIEMIKDVELVEFRLRLLQFIKNLQPVQTKNDDTTKEKEDEEQKFLAMMECLYAPCLDIDPSLLTGQQQQHQQHNIQSSNSFSLLSLDPHSSSPQFSSKVANVDISVHVSETNQPGTVYRVSMPLATSTPLDVTIAVITKKLSQLQQSQEKINEVLARYMHSYMLNVCGCDEIFWGNSHPLQKYKYIRKCLSDSIEPQFHLISVDKLRAAKTLKQDPLYASLIEKYIKEQQSLLNERKKSQSLKNSVDLSSWSSNELFTIYFDNLLYLPYLKECSKVFLKVAVYHGQELATHSVIESEKVELERLGKDSSLRLNHTVHLNVPVRNFHRNAKLCLSLYCVSKKKREFFSIGWISLNLFDYTGYLIQGKRKLYLWQTTQNSFLNLCLSDVTGQNPDKDYIRLNAEFLRNRQDERAIAYPSQEKIKGIINRSSDNSQDDCFDVSYALENDNALLESILGKDALAELSEQEKNVLWRRRGDCINYPHSLPKLLQSVKWSNPVEVVEMYNYLYRWPDIKPTCAIELLHSTHSDSEVRTFAVRCLDKHMRDEEVGQYLLQLVQTLKNEPYYDNALTRFLLRRALRSQRIGFDLFWNLKTEMEKPRYKYRFGLILEAYCRGISTSELKDLLKQVEVVDRLAGLAKEIKSNPDNISLVKSSFLQDTLGKPDFRESISNFISPLNRSHILCAIQPEKCRILTSKKRPLYLTWSNTTDYAKFYDKKQFELIFKHGDDLRQDMLTLQLLKLMDIIWKSEGLDLKMLIYDCFSTGHQVGFIQVITNSLTLFKIQMEGGMRSRYQVDTSQLYKWIAAQNSQSAEKLDKAVDSFTKSCAGFCVATFILGIGDRHPDNIMVNQNGKLFHIDFGHFLGHFKKKYGIKRERVPFVLTEDFSKVITRCSATPMDTVEFRKFRVLCEQAYMVIRRYSHLIVNLFTLMLSSDMPELQSIEDIMYLRKTLAIDETDEKALEYFRSQFNEAYKMSFTTKLDWMCHALNRKNLI